MSKEQFDFSQNADQKQFEKLPTEAKDILIEHAHEEALENQEIELAEAEAKKMEDFLAGQKNVGMEKGDQGLLESDVIMAYYKAADLCKKTGLFERAIENYEKARTILPLPKYPPQRDLIQEKIDVVKNKILNKEFKEFAEKEQQERQQKKTEK